MIELTDVQRDVLTEIINVGMGRAAGSLSRLTGERVHLSVPRVDFMNLRELDEHLPAETQAGVCSVLQVFKGEVSGDAVLFLPEASALKLVELLVGRPSPANHMSELEQAALLEVGNIILNACLGSLSNALETRFTFLVPEVSARSIKPMLRGNAADDHPELRNRVCLLVESRFEVKASQITGFLAIVLGVASAEVLASAADRLGNPRAGGAS